MQDEYQLNKELEYIERITQLEKELEEKETIKFNKDEANLLFKIQVCKKELDTRNIKKSGHNNYNNYSYYELEDINPHIHEVTCKQNIATLFQFSNNVAYLYIIDEKTGASQTWQTPLCSSERYNKKYKQQGKKGDVGELMKDQQALQTYARRTLLLQAFEISEPNSIEADNETKSKFKLPDTPLFKQVTTDFKKAGVEINKQTVTNKLRSMCKSGKISKEEYQEAVGELE